jgi:RHS repeat-associated protein
LEIIIDNNGDLSMVQSARCLDSTPGTNAACTAQAGLWNYAQNFTYNPAGAVTSMQLGNNRWESTQFNSRLQPTQIALGTVQNGTDKLKLEYGYGSTANNGNVLSQKITIKRPSQSDLVFDQLYTYDTLNRITSAEEKTGTTVNWNQTYTFDRYGNRNFNESLTTTLPKGCMDGSTPVVCEADKEIFNPDLNPSNNRMAANQGWSYDAAGNVITDAEGRQFSYDAENKQREVKDSLNQTIGQYFFDGDGKRVKKIVPGTGEATIFVYDAGGKLIGEYSTAISQEPKVQYLTNDHLGSPRINTDQDGNITSRTDYMPYGEEIIALGNRTANDHYLGDDVRQGFTGYENDEETELDFAQARYYNCRLGRFKSPDPLYLELRRLSDPQRLNLVVYTRNRPFLYRDPSGLEIEVIDETANKRGRNEYLGLVNGRKDGKFRVGIDRKSGTLQIVDSKGKALTADSLKNLGDGLEGSEKELFNAITDKENRGTVVLVRDDPSVLTFGASDGPGRNYLDLGDLAKLSASNPSMTNASNISLHETLEAYASARDPSIDAHEYASGFYPGLGERRSGEPEYNRRKTRIIGGTYFFPIDNGNGAELEISVRFVTPIDPNSLPKPGTPIPWNIIKVREIP